MISDFSLLVVYSSSSSTVPLLYKIFGLWTSPEGSTLLFVWVLSLYNVLYLLLGVGNGSAHKRIVLEIQSLILALFLLFAIFVANPFQVNESGGDEGLGLNPLLQDVALAIHPPVLYIGYIGFSIVFSIAIAYCYKPNNVNLGKVLKSWVLLTWSLLTIGVSLGSWWAYRELGWGGFWFWDPVENISLIPWVLGLALIHAILLVQKHKSLESWVIFLSILTFVSSIGGAFLIRSGVLNSVHSFAGGGEQVIYMMILMLSISICGITAYVFFYRRRVDRYRGSHTFSSHDNALLLNNCFLLLSAFAILVGVMYPVFCEYFTSSSIVISADYYNSVLRQILLPFLLVWGIGPQLIAKTNTMKRNVFPFCIATLVVLYLDIGNVLTSLLLILSIWLFLSILISFFIRAGVFTNSVSKSLTFIVRLDKSYYAMFFAHLGGALLVFAIVCNAHFAKQSDVYMQIGETLEVSRYSMRLEKVIIAEEANYKALKAILHVNNSFYLSPEFRFYNIEEQNTAETAIYHDFLSNLYVVISEIDEELGLGVEVSYNPLINLIWISAFLMSVGGILGVFRKREACNAENVE